jgi:hypothetical protein
MHDASKKRQNNPIHYGRQLLCRVPDALPSAKSRALGKEAVCRVSALSKVNTRQKGPLPTV